MEFADGSAEALQGGSSGGPEIDQELKALLVTAQTRGVNPKSTDPSVAPKNEAESPISAALKKAEENQRTKLILDNLKRRLMGTVYSSGKVPTLPDLMVSIDLARASAEVKLFGPMDVRFGVSEKIGNCLVLPAKEFGAEIVDNQMGGGILRPTEQNVNVVLHLKNGSLRATFEPQSR